MWVVRVYIAVVRESELQQAEVNELSARFASLNNEVASRPMEHRVQLGGLEQRLGKETGITPPMGKLKLEGFGTPGSLDLEAWIKLLEEAESSTIPKLHHLHIFAGGASSPFEKCREGQGSPQSEPRPGFRARGAVASKLRPSTRSSQAGMEEAPKELGWVQQGRLELEELFPRKKEAVNLILHPSQMRNPSKAQDCVLFLAWRNRDQTATSTSKIPKA